MKPSRASSLPADAPIPTIGKVFLLSLMTEILLEAQKIFIFTSTILFFSLLSSDVHLRSYALTAIWHRKEGKYSVTIQCN